MRLANGCGSGVLKDHFSSGLHRKVVFLEVAIRFEDFESETQLTSESIGHDIQFNSMF